MTRKFTFIGVLLAFSLIISSCGTNAEDIKLSDLETACDYVDAQIVCAEAIIDMGEDKDFSDFDEWLEEDKEELEAIKKKVVEIRAAFRKKYTEAEFKECDSYEELLKLKKELNNID